MAGGAGGQGAGLEGRGRRSGAELEGRGRRSGGGAGGARQAWRAARGRVWRGAARLKRAADVGRGSVGGSWAGQTGGGASHCVPGLASEKPLPVRCTRGGVAACGALLGAFLPGGGVPSSAGGGAESGSLRPSESSGVREGALPESKRQVSRKPGSGQATPDDSETQGRGVTAWKRVPPLGWWGAAPENRGSALKGCPLVVITRPCSPCSWSFPGCPGHSS